MPYDWTQAVDRDILVRLRLLILGPHQSVGDLRWLTEQVKSTGLTNARLVMDFPIPTPRYDEPEQAYNLRKSEYWIDQADSYLLVFVTGVDNGSVADESQMIIEMKDKAHHAIAFLPSGAGPASLPIGRIQRHGRIIYTIHYDSFREPENIERLEGAVRELATELASVIRARSPSEWESYGSL